MLRRLMLELALILLRRCVIGLLLLLRVRCILFALRFSKLIGFAVLRPPLSLALVPLIWVRRVSFFGCLSPLLRLMLMQLGLCLVTMCYRTLAAPRMFLILLVNLARSFDEVFAMPVFRSAYDGLSRSSSVSTSVDFSDSPSLAVQAAKDDCDINVIMTRFGRGVPMPVPRAVASYGDFSDVTDYQDALDGLSASEATFNALPSRIRARFGNSPGALWSFLHDSSNEEEARKLGLLEPLPVVPDPVAVRLVPEAVVVPPAAS